MMPRICFSISVTLEGESQKTNMPERFSCFDNPDIETYDPLAVFRFAQEACIH